MYFSVLQLPFIILLFFFSAEKSSFHSLEHAFLYILEVNYNSPLTSMYVNSKSWVISRLVFIDCCFILLMGMFSCILLSPRYLECHIVENLDSGISKFVLNYKLSFLVAPQILVQFFVLNWSVSHTCFRGKWEILVEFTPASQGFYYISLDQNSHFFLGSWDFPKLYPQVLQVRKAMYFLIKDLVTPCSARFHLPSR